MGRPHNIKKKKKKKKKIYFRLSLFSMESRISHRILDAQELQELGSYIFAANWRYQRAKGFA